MAADGDSVSGTSKVKGVKITNPARRVFDTPAVTKLQVAED